MTNKSFIDKFEDYILKMNTGRLRSILFNIFVPVLIYVVITFIAVVILYQLNIHSSVLIQSIANVPLFLILLYIYVHTKKVLSDNSDDMRVLDLQHILALGFAVSIFANILINIVSKIFGIVDNSTVTEEILQSDIYVALFISCISAPIAEELFYRGFIFKAFNRYFGFWISAISSSLIFAFAHVTPLVMIFAFICSMFLSFIYYRYKSLIMCMILHMAVNLTSLMIYDSSIINLSYKELIFIFFVAFVLIIMLSFRIYTKTKTINS